MNSNPQIGVSKLSAAAFDTESHWQQLLARDAGAQFFYAVTSTGVFCRPACSSRRPSRENVRFFRTAEEAQAAGFRPCLRCRPETAIEPEPVDVLRRYIEANVEKPVRLAELSRLVRMSPFTVQRLFKRTVGASPLQYQRALRANRLRAELKRGQTVTNAIYEAGFNTSSRAYDAAQLGMTPSRFATGGRGEVIGFTIANSHFGWLIVGATQRGLCWLALAESEPGAEASLREEFPAAQLQRDDSLRAFVQAALAAVGEELAQSDGSISLPLDLRGTAFQLRVWSALRAIPLGETRSYSQLAVEMGIPTSTRAVARACALNRVSLVVPCHRVVGASGSLTGYRWGVERKKKLLEAEKNARKN